MFTPPTNLEDLMAGLSKVNPFSAIVNSAAESNVEVHFNITVVLQALDDIQYNSLFMQRKSIWHLWKRS